MITFFRRIRQRLLSDTKIGKYLIYAVGEIILVVVGILIALSINNWNTQRLNMEREGHILLEIADNLNEDLQSIEEVLSENGLKIKAIDSAFYYLSEMSRQPIIAREFGNLMPVLTNNSLFKPTRVAFDNMISSGNSNILVSDALRKEISRYYSSDLLHGIQEQLVSTTQGFLEVTAPKMVNDAMLKQVTSLNFKIRPLEAISVYKDPDVIAHLFVMKSKSLHHNNILNKKKTEIRKLITSINGYLSKR